MSENRVHKSLFFYFLSGLNIASDFELPELTLSYSDNIHINIYKGVIPEFIEDVVMSNSVFQFSESSQLVDIKDVARFLIKNNGEVIVQAYENADAASIRVYLLGLVFAIVLIQRNYLSLHASTIKLSRSTAILVCGHSGAGKSTTALGFYTKGYEVLNDDISTVGFDAEGLPVVYPGVRYIKLKEQSLNEYGYKKSDFEELKRAGKYNFPFPSTRENVAIPIKTIFFLEKSNLPEIQHKFLNGMDIFENIATNTFRFHVIKMLKKKEVHFELCKRLIPRVRFIKVIRPEILRPPELVNYIEAILSSINGSNVITV